MSCSCNSNPCVCPAQCPEACPDLVQQECQNVNLVGIGVYDSETEGVYGFRGLRGGDSSVQVAYNAALGTVDLTNLAFDDNPTRTFANAGARAAATPDFVGQLAIQVDTLIAYTANGLTAGAWALTISNGQPLNADLTAIAALGTTGLIVRTAANTFVTRTITGGAKVSVTFGNGVVTNPNFTVLEAGLDKNAIGGSVLSIANGGTGTSTGIPVQFGTAIRIETQDAQDVVTADATVEVDTGDGSSEIYLPSAALFSGRIFTIRQNSSAGAGSVLTVKRHGTGKIDNAATFTIIQPGAIEVQSDGTNWWVIGRLIP